MVLRQQLRELRNVVPLHIALVWFHLVEHTLLGKHLREEVLVLHFVPFALQSLRALLEHTLVVVLCHEGSRCIHRLLLFGDVLQLLHGFCRTTEGIQHLASLGYPVLQFRSHTHTGVFYVEFLQRMLGRMSCHVEHSIQCFQLLCVGLQVTLVHAERRVLRAWQLHRSPFD